MEALTLKQVTEWISARVTGTDERLLPEIRISGASTDTRAFEAGQLYVALSGEHFDGHTFVPAAVAAGAAAAVVGREMPDLPGGFPQLVVPDTLAALQALAAAYRSALPTRIVGVTGSNGKTTTKEFCSTVLGSAFSVASTRGNLNNHIGVPLTLLSLDTRHQIAVVEMGMNHSGEIAPLAAMARPEVGVITNVGMAHIEHLGSRGAIADEKGVLAAALPPGGCLVLDADGEFADRLAARTGAKVVRVGLSKGEIRADGIRVGSDGSRFTVRSAEGAFEGHLPVPGEHMIRNALFAVAVGGCFGLGVEASLRALAEASAGRGRLQQREIRGVRVIDDTYNANPDSMVAALETVARMETAGRKVAVLGQMNELGEFSGQGHARVGEAAAGRLDALITVGPVAEAIAQAARAAGFAAAETAASVEEAVARLESMLHPGDLLLVKGSRGARMERVIEAYEKGAPDPVSGP